MKLIASEGHFILSLDADPFGDALSLRFELITLESGDPWLRVWGRPNVNSRWYITSALDGQKIYDGIVDAFEEWFIDDCLEDDSLDIDVSAVISRIADYDKVLADEFAFMHNMRRRARAQDRTHSSRLYQLRVEPHAQAVEEYIDSLSFLPATVSIPVRTKLKECIKAHIISHLSYRNKFPVGIHEILINARRWRYLKHDFGQESAARPCLVSVIPDNVIHRPHPSSGLAEG